MTSALQFSSEYYKVRAWLRFCSCCWLQVLHLPSLMTFHRVRLPTDCLTALLLFRCKFPSQRPNTCLLFLSSTRQYLIRERGNICPRGAERNAASALSSLQHLALLCSGGEPESFIRCLARCLRSQKPLLLLLSPGLCVLARVDKLELPGPK